MKIISTLFVVFTSFASLSSVVPATPCRSPAGETFADAKTRLANKLLTAVLSYARNEAHPTTGYVLDTVGNYGPTDARHGRRSSISSTGFMMALMAVGSKKGLVSEAEALNYCRKPVLSVIAKKKLDATRAAQRGDKAPNPYTDISYRGWFSHFIDWETGDRWLDSEYAVTDSIWFVSGAIVCAMTFPDSDLTSLVDSAIYGDVDFMAMMTDEGKHPDKRTLSMSYLAPFPGETPELAKQKGKHLGYAPFQWEIYQHSWLPYLLGLGSPEPTHRLPAASWSAWRRSGDTITSTDSRLNGQFIYGDRRAFFSHYFPAVFLPPKEIKEYCGKVPHGLDYFKNSQLAALLNQVNSEQDTTSKTFRAGFWGLDAGPNPIVSLVTPVTDDSLEVGALETNGYGVNAPFKRNGTACLPCAVASAMFDPDLAFSSLRRWCDDPKYGDKLWGKYGPANGINLDYGWISPYSLSGVVGPMALSVANVDAETSVWKQFMKSKWVRLGLTQAEAAPAPPDGCRSSEDRPAVEAKK